MSGSLYSGLPNAPENRHPRACVRARECGCAGPKPCIRSPKVFSGRKKRRDSGAKCDHYTHQSDNLNMSARAPACCPYVHTWGGGDE